jgi:hypothetical protein
MQNKTPSTPPGPTADNVRRYVSALPTTSETALLDERTAQAARSVLRRTDSLWEQRLQAQIDNVTKEVAAYLDLDGESGRYVISVMELQGIVARAVSRTAGQFAMDVGQALTDTSTRFSSVLAQTDNTDDAAEGHEQPNLLQES